MNDMEEEKYDKVSESIVAPYPDTVGAIRFLLVACRKFIHGITINNLYR